MTSSVQSALAILESERARLDRAIDALKGIEGNGVVVKRGPGRPRKDASSAPAPRKAKSGPRKRAPRGLLQAKAHQALKSLKAPASASALRDAVLKMGYPGKSKASVYTALFALAKKKGSGVKKTKDGFVLAGKA